MANIFGKIMDKLNLPSDTDEDDELFDEDDAYQDTYRENRKISRNVKKNNDYDDQYEEEEEVQEPEPRQSFFSKKNNNVLNMKSIAGGKGTKMEVKVIRPTVYDDAREICDTLSSGTPVVLNLEGIKTELAQKIIDFTAGAVYAMNGTVSNVTKYIFVITPNNVTVSGNFDEMLDGTIDFSGNSGYVYRD